MSLKSKWWCVLLGHKWGARYEIGDTGDYDRDCDRCPASWDTKHSFIWPQQWWWILRYKFFLAREFFFGDLHKIMCKIGRHQYTDLDEDFIVCPWCWKEKDSNDK